MEFLDSVRNTRECLDHPCLFGSAPNRVGAPGAHCAVATCARGHIFSKYVPRIFVRMPDIGGGLVPRVRPRLSVSGGLCVCVSSKGTLGRFHCDSELSQVFGIMVTSQEMTPASWLVTHF